MPKRSSEGVAHGLSSSSIGAWQLRIEGSVHDYIVAAPYATDFRYSRFATDDRQRTREVSSRWIERCRKGRGRVRPSSDHGEDGRSRPLPIRHIESPGKCVNQRRRPVVYPP